MKHHTFVTVGILLAWLGPWGAPAEAQAETSPDEQAAPGDTAAMLRLHDTIRRTLAYYHSKPLNNRDHNCWELMHSIVAYGVDSQVLRGGPAGTPVNAIGWLCYGNRSGGQTLVSVAQGRIAVAKGPRVQGHHGQFLAIIAQAKVRSDYPIEIGHNHFTLVDLIESEKLGCQTGTELTFKLIALAHYLDSDATWQSADGQPWSISRLVAEEIKSPIIGAACGGTHRLMGISYAVRERAKQGQPIDGQFHRADRYVRDYHQYAFRLQNADGSFSTDWFKGRAAKPDLDRRLQTTGHILEWLAYSVSDETLDDPRLVKAVAYLTGILAANPQRSWSIGPLGHGLHALKIYDERRFKTRDLGEAGTLARRGDTPQQVPEAADKPAKTTKRRRLAVSPDSTRPEAQESTTEATPDDASEQPAPDALPPAELPCSEINPAQPLSPADDGCDPEEAGASHVDD